MKSSSYDSSKQKRKKPKNTASSNSSKQITNPPTVIASNNLESKQTSSIQSEDQISQTTIDSGIGSSLSKNNTNDDKLANVEVISDSETISSRRLTEEIIIDSSLANIIDVSNNEFTQIIDNNQANNAPNITTTITTTITATSGNDDTLSQSSLQTNVSSVETTNKDSQSTVQNDTDYVNPRGVRFVQEGTNNSPAVPYGLPCVRELLRFLISLINS